MQTFVTYNFILFGATFFAYLYEKSKVKGTQKLYLFLSFFIPFIFLALRYDIGTDYRSYVDYFYRIADGEFVLKEPAYLFINKVIYILGLDVQWVFVIFGFIFMTFAYKALPKKGFAFGVFLFICYLYLYEGYTMLRQGAATVIMAYGIQFIVERQFIKYFMLSLFAMSLHLVTGFILLLVYPIVSRKYNRWILLSVLFSMYFIVIKTSIILDTISFFISLFPRYSWYIDSEFMKSATYATGLGTLAKLLLGATVIFFKDSISKKHKNANVVINLYFCFLVGMILHIEILILLRIEHMFVFAQVLALIYFVLTIEKKSRIFVVLGIGTFFFAMFNWYITAGTLERDNDIYINPYQTILSR